MTKMISILGILSIILSGCVNSASSRKKQKNSLASNALLIKGNVVLGVLQGAKVTAYPLLASGSLDLARPLATTTTDINGNYTLSLPGLNNSSSPIGIQATDGSYEEEASGQRVWLRGKKLTAIIPSLKSTQQIVAAIGPLTDIAYKIFESRMQAPGAGGNSLAQNAIQANYQVSQAFGVSDIIKTLPAIPKGILPTGDSGKYTLILAALSHAAQSAGTDSTALSSAYAKHLAQNGDFSQAGSKAISVTNAAGDPVTVTPPTLSTLSNLAADISSGEIVIAGVQIPTNFKIPQFNTLPIADGPVSTPTNIPKMPTAVVPVIIPQVITCSSFSYSAYGACLANSTQSRTVIVGSPINCVGGNPVTTQACTYIPPAKAPSAPTIESVIAGNGKVDITFKAPLSDGGSPITSYTVTSSSGRTLIGQSPMTMLSLLNGTAYTFKVKATNAIGTGVDSSASQSVVPKAPFLALKFLTPFPAAGNGTFSFPIISTDGSPITLEAAQVVLGGSAKAGCNKTILGVGTTTPTIQISGCSGNGPINVSLTECANQTTPGCSSIVGPSTDVIVINQDPSDYSIASDYNSVYINAAGEPIPYELHFPSNWQNMSNLPLYIHIHGGGWRAGSASDDAILSKAIAAKGFVVANLNYRLAPHLGGAIASAPYSAGPEDIKAFIKNVITPSIMTGINVDISKVSIGGSSAGAHLALFQATREDNSFNFNCVLNMSGPTDLTSIIAQTPTQSYLPNAIADMTELLFGVWGNNNYVLATHSPALLTNTFKGQRLHILHAVNDNLVNINQAYSLATNFSKAKPNLELTQNYWPQPNPDLLNYNHGWITPAAQALPMASIASYMSSRCKGVIGPALPPTCSVSLSPTNNMSPGTTIVATIKSTQLSNVLYSVNGGKETAFPTNNGNFAFPAGSAGNYVMAYTGYKADGTKITCTGQTNITVEAPPSCSVTLSPNKNIPAGSTIVATIKSAQLSKIMYSVNGSLETAFPTNNGNFSFPAGSAGNYAMAYSGYKTDGSKVTCSGEANVTVATPPSTCSVTLSPANNMPAGSIIVATIKSSNLTDVKFSVNGSAEVAFPTNNGNFSFTAGSPGNYAMAYSGTRPDGTRMTCEGGANVTVVTPPASCSVTLSPANNMPAGSIIVATIKSTQLSNVNFSINGSPESAFPTTNGDFSFAAGGVGNYSIDYSGTKTDGTKIICSGGSIITVK